MGWLFGTGRKQRMPSAEDALPGREQAVPVAPEHLVLHHPMTEPYPDGYEVLDVAFGCFWGAEQLFWQQDGVWTTAVGYQGGSTPNPTYDEVCSGGTGHAEAVRVVFDPAATSYENLLKIFWENHDPTQGMRQGNDVGTQYRSAIYTHGDAQQETAERSRDAYAASLKQAGFDDVTTEIVAAGPFYFAEDYHQQYLYKNPHGYCPVHTTGVACRVPE